MSEAASMVVTPVGVAALPGSINTFRTPTGTTILSQLPLPSIQMARGLASANSLLTSDELQNLSAFDLFKIQLESGSTEAAIDAMKRLGVVCQAVGPEITSSQVVPYLTRLVLQQQPTQTGAASVSAPGAAPAGAPQPGAPTNNVLLSDELLLLLGSEILDVNDVLLDQQDSFLPLLERLSAVEETVVRDQAVTTLSSLCQQKTASVSALVAVSPFDSDTANAAVSPWIALVKRLSSADWFTAKVSSCGIVAPIFGLVNATAAHSGLMSDHMDITTSTSPSGSGGGAEASGLATPQQLQCYELLLNLYKELCTDETPMVRRAAAKNFGHVLKQAGWNHRDFAANLLGPVLCRDEQDSVRLLAVSSLKDVGPVFGKMNPQWTVKYWLPIVKDGSTDMSW